MRWPADWKIRNCLYLCGSITLLQVVLTALATSGIDVPILHQAVGFVFVTFLPGILILRILKIHNVNIIESIAYSSGLSLALVMFSAAAVNFLLPILSVPHPIALWPITITLSVETAILMAAAWLRDSNYIPSAAEQLKLPSLLNASLFLFIILLLIILGVKVSDMTGSNSLLVISLLLIVAVVCLAAFNKMIPSELYPLALFIIGLGLLYQTTLMSPYLVGSDIYTEYSYFRETAGGGVWDSSLPNPVNSCLSIVMLGPVYSLLMGIDGIWVFKAVYPLVFALVPLILFRVFKSQIGAAPSFFAVFFFMAVPTFSLEMVSLCRQQIAELFLALTILLLVERNLNILTKLLLLVIFTFSIAISHYSIGFITIAYLVILIPLLAILRSRLFIRAWGKLTSRTGGLPTSLTQMIMNTLPVKLLIIPVVLYVAFLLMWYSQVASGVNLYFISNVLNFQISAIGQEVSNGLNHAASAPLAHISNRPDLIRAALGLDFFDVTWQGKLFRLFQYATQILIVIGCFRLLLSPRHLNFMPAYIAFSVTSSGLLTACILFPGFAGILNATRWYHISLLTLAPFCIVGAETVWLLLLLVRQKFRRPHTSTTTTNGHPEYLIYLSLLILAPYFIFTSGLVFEFSGRSDISRAETPYSIALSSHKLDIAGILDYHDVSAAVWLADKHDSAYPVYTDNHACKIASLYKYNVPFYSFPRDGEKIQPGYLYFTTRNNERQELTFSTMGKPGLREHVAIQNIPGLPELLSAANLIYSNSDSTVYIYQR